MTSLPEFSFIMPTFNRAHCICAAIDSVLAQTYPKFELIIVDDGSTDGTLSLLDSKYSTELSTKKIAVVKGMHSGVCKARNLGLKVASKEWIAYIDTDNVISPNFLASYVQMIKENPTARNFYSKAHIVGSKQCIGRSFDLDELIKQNFIDIGTYVHHKSLIDELGGFDENMTRLVDWELIVRQSKVCTPVFIDIPLLEYDNSSKHPRITTTENLVHNQTYLRNKFRSTESVQNNSVFFKIVVPNYNNMPYIKECLDSILSQSFQDFKLIIVDDQSTDLSDYFCEMYARKYPEKIIYHKLESKGCAGKARNWGLDYPLQSKYTWFIDGDDFLKHHNVLMNCRQSLVRNDFPDIFVFCVDRLIANGQQQLWNIGCEQQLSRWTKRLLNCPWNGAPLHIIKSELVQHSIENCAYGEDSFQWLLSWNQSEGLPTYAQTSDVYYVYRQNLNSLTQQYLKDDKSMRKLTQLIFFENLLELAAHCKNIYVKASIEYRLRDKNMPEDIRQKIKLLLNTYNF